MNPNSIVLALILLISVINCWFLFDERRDRRAALKTSTKPALAWDEYGDYDDEDYVRDVDPRMIHRDPTPEEAADPMHAIWEANPGGRLYWATEEDKAAAEAETLAMLVEIFGEEAVYGKPLLAAVSDEEQAEPVMYEVHPKPEPVRVQCLTEERAARIEARSAAVKAILGDLIEVTEERANRWADRSEDEFAALLTEFKEIAHRWFEHEECPEMAAYWNLPSGVVTSPKDHRSSAPVLDWDDI